MKRTAWHTERTGACTIVARTLPARFDVSASAVFPLASPTRLAHQIRQDMWRALQDVRGFSPVVRVEQGETELTVTAGGRAMRPISPKLEEKIGELLNDASRLSRWLSCAKRRAS